MKKNNLSFEQQCKDEEIVAEVTKQILDYGSKTLLLKHEIPKKITLCPQVWTPENGLLSSALKLKRKQIEEFYCNHINRMYNSP